MGPVLCAVVAVAKNGVIGKDGDLPWRLSSDLKMFRRLTMGKPIIMGRRTWGTLQKRPLDGRDNIVVTRDQDFAAEGALVTHSIDAAIDHATVCAKTRGVDEIMVIGGAEIYAGVMERVSRIYLSEVEGEPDGDTFFPDLSAEIWTEVSREPIERGPRDEFGAQIVVLERV